MRFRRKVRRRRRPFAGKARRRQGLPRRSRFHRAAASKVIIRQPSGLPDRLFVKLKYVDTLVFTSTSGANATQIYRGNSLYDPDFTSTGHQPYYFDQWSALYGAYIVHASSIRIECQPSESAASTNSYMQWCVVPTLATTGFTSATDVAEEQPYAKFKTVGGSNVTFNRIKHHMSTRKVWGVPKGFELGNPNYRSTVSTNPVDPWFWNVTAAAGDLAASVTQVCQIRLIYYCEFYARGRPSQS